MGKFGKLNRAVDRFGSWVGAYTIMSGVFAWVAARMAFIHIGWPEAVFIGVGATGFVVLFMSAGLIAWRYFHPLRESTRPQFPDPKKPADGDIDAKLDEFLATKLRAEFTTHAQTHAYDEKLAALGAELRTLKGSVEGLGDLLGVRHRELKDRIDEVAKGCADLEEKVSAAYRQVHDEIDSRCEGLDQAFRALQNREWHRRLFSQLESDFAEIARPIDAAAGIADEEEWKRQLKSWRGKLDQWLLVVDFYANGARDKILATPEFLYDGEWPLDETKFTANQIHRYKETAIWWHNAQEEWPRIERALATAAFEVPSKKRRLSGPPRIDEDQ